MTGLIDSVCSFIIDIICFFAVIVSEVTYSLSEHGFVSNGDSFNLFG